MMQFDMHGSICIWMVQFDMHRDRHEIKAGYNASHPITTATHNIEHFKLFIITVKKPHGFNKAVFRSRNIKF